MKDTPEELAPREETEKTPQMPVQTLPHLHYQQETNEGINLSYTINLNLPATEDIEVFNAIFKSLKQHLLLK